MVPLAIVSGLLKNPNHAPLTLHESVQGDHGV